MSFRRVPGLRYVRDRRIPRRDFVPDFAATNRRRDAADSIPARCSLTAQACRRAEGRSVLGRTLTNNRDDRRARRNGHPSSNGWPNFDLASFLDAYYHPKNRTKPAPRRMSAGPEMDRPASPMPLAPQTAGLSSTNVSSSQSADRAGWLSNRKHTSSPEDDGSEEST